MKINRLSTYHKGSQPVRVLQHNVTHQFETTNPTFIELTKEIIAKNGLQPGITYHINDSPIYQPAGALNQTPCVGGDKKIVIHETFLSYVWCMSYSLIVLYDEGVAKPSQNEVAQRALYEIDTVRIDKAQELFKYALSIVKVFSKWDKSSLPNPEEYDGADAFWIERANSVFVYAMNFILCHEFVHVEKEHIDKLIAGQNQDSQVLAFEKEADQRAIDLVLLGATDETRRTVQFGILVGLCCLLFLRRETQSTDHPDTDDRIDNFLKMINPDPADGLWGVATLSFRLWDEQFSKSFNWPKGVHDMKELYLHVKKQIEDEKK